MQRLCYLKSVDLLCALFENIFMSTEPLKILGKRIRGFREELALSQEQLAELSELHRTYIGSVERGERNISFKNILRIAKALKITPSKLLHGIK